MIATTDEGTTRALLAAAVEVHGVCTCVLDDNRNWFWIHWTYEFV